MNNRYPVIESKLPHTGTTIFTVMSKMANEYGAINLSQGFPGFPIDSELIDLVHKYMKEGHNQYAPMPGVLRLREKLSDKLYSLYTVEYNPTTEIVVTAGATQALYTAITALVNEGDQVIVIEPAYDSYVPAIEINRGIPVFSRLYAPDYSIDWEDIESKITSRTKLLIINSPHNPTGTVIDKTDLDQLERLAVQYNLLVISDEVYEHLVFDELPHESVVKRPALRERSLVTFSFGKVFHVTGWKTGYCIGPEWLMKEFVKIHQFQSFSCSNPMQNAFADYLCNENNYLSLPKFFERKRDVLLKELTSSKFQMIPSSGTYFQLLDYSAISDEGDKVFAERLTREIGVASIPISVFYHDGWDQKMIRLCFAKEDNTLIEAAARLNSI